jgi:hypothetical protein
MTKTIPKWVMKRYAKLWKKFSDKEFTFDDIEKTLKIDDKRIISVFLNELKNAGWVEAKLHPNDSRMRKYKLKNPVEVMEEITTE